MTSWIDPERDSAVGGYTGLARYQDFSHFSLMENFEAVRNWPKAVIQPEFLNDRFGAKAVNQIF